MDQSKKLVTLGERIDVSLPPLRHGEAVIVVNKSAEPINVLPNGRLEITPAMSAYAIYDKLVSGLAMVDMLNMGELEALAAMLKHHRWCDDLEKKVIHDMLDYVNVQLVSDKITNAVK